MSGTTIPVRRVRRVRPAAVARWVLQAALASQFVGAGVMKLSGDPAMVAMFAEIGAGQWLRYLVGGLELAGAIGLLVPRLCGVAALGLIGLMAGAVLTNLVVLGESPVLPLAFGCVAGLVAWLRRTEVRELARKAVRR
ncbi:DoxX family protein [Flindersiella endophytica]